MTNAAGNNIVGIRASVVVIGGDSVIGSRMEMFWLDSRARRAAWFKDACYLGSNVIWLSGMVESHFIENKGRIKAGLSDIMVTY